MFTTAKIRNGETYLDHHLSANDYYTEKESVEGVWVGEGARHLGIEGQPIAAGDAAFERFRNNLKPDGTRLTERGGENRVRFIDIQCGAPKSVSVQAITLGDFRLQGAHERAVTRAYAELQKFAACQDNSLTERHNRFTGNLITARFTHTASRALDPQLHDHLVTVSATYDQATGSWKALTEYEILKAIRYCGKVYQNELAKECRRLGYELRPSYDNRQRVCGFELAGISPELVKRFSKRRAQVERGIEHFKHIHGREPSAAEIHTITCQTRDPKLKEATTPEVIGAQRAQLTPAELTDLDTLKRIAMQKAREAIVAPELGSERMSLRQAIATTFERASVVKGHALLAEALNQNVGKIDLAQLQRLIAGDDLVRLSSGRSPDGLDAAYVTPAGLKRERWVLAVSREDKGELAPLASGPVTGEQLSPEQRSTVETLIKCRDRMACLRGAAGTGKTTVLREVDRLLREAGRDVVYCAPTSSAKDVLVNDGAQGASTVAALLNKEAPDSFRPGTVVIVDEAGMLSMREGQSLMRVCLEKDCRLLLVGDTRQHTAVEAGDFLRHLEKHAAVHRVELTDIRRQQVADYRESVRCFASGRAMRGMEKLDATGRIHEHGAEYLIEAAKTYTRRMEESGLEEVIGVSPTWEEGRAFTASIRQELKRAGKLSEGIPIPTQQSLGWTDEQKRTAANYFEGLTLVMTSKTRDFSRGESLRVESVEGDKIKVRDAHNKIRPFKPTRGGFDVCETRVIEVSVGDRLLIQANAPQLGLTNGALVRVSAVEDGRISLSEGQSLNPMEFGRFTHGYVMTSHKSQGKTADHVVIAATRLDAKSAYVATSRGRKNCDIHTPDKAMLMQSLPDGDRLLATESITDPVEIPATGESALDVARKLKSLQVAHPILALVPGGSNRPNEKSLAREVIDEPTSSL